MLYQSSHIYKDWEKPDFNIFEMGRVGIEPTTRWLRGSNVKFKLLIINNFISYDARYNAQ